MHIIKSEHTQKQLRGIKKMHCPIVVLEVILLGCSIAR